MNNNVPCSGVLGIHPGLFSLFRAPQYSQPIDAPFASG